MFSITSLTIISLIGAILIEFGSTSYTSDAAIEESERPCNSLECQFGQMQEDEEPHGNAKRECKNLMDGYLFDNDRIYGGEKNFRIAYYSLTRNLIESHFCEMQEDEEPHEDETKELQSELFLHYFMDLNLNHNRALGLKSIKDWCQEYAKEAGMFDNPILIEKEAQLCEKSIKDKFNIDDSKTPKEIFNLFYYDWTIDDLKNDSVNDTTSTINLTDGFDNEFSINLPVFGNNAFNYPIKFFEYYGEEVMNPVLFQYENIAVTAGFFRTIREFCDFAGYKTLAENVTLS